MMQNLHLLRNNSFTAVAGSFLLLLLRQGPHGATVDLLDVIGNILLVQVVLVELWKHLSHVIDYQLRQLSIVVFNDEAEELAVVVVDDVAHLLLEWKWCQLLPFELCVVFADVHDIHFILDFEGFVHFV